jgi:hypothetical protein
VASWEGNKACGHEMFIKEEGLCHLLEFHDNETYGVGVTKILIGIFFQYFLCFYFDIVGGMYLEMLGLDFNLSKKKKSSLMP